MLLSSFVILVVIVVALAVIFGLFEPAIRAQRNHGEPPEGLQELVEKSEALAKEKQTIQEDVAEKEETISKIKNNLNN